MPCVYSHAAIVSLPDREEASRCDKYIFFQSFVIDLQGVNPFRERYSEEGAPGRIGYGCIFREVFQYAVPHLNDL